MKTILLTIIIAFPTLAAFGQVTESNYQKVRKMNDLREKKRFVLGLERHDQLTVWRDHYAHIFATETLTLEQREYLARTLEAFEADELTDELDQEAKDLFRFDLGKKVFNPGPFIEDSTACVEPKMDFKPKGFTFAFAASKRSFVDCNCRQTGTNWGCSGYCTVSSCSLTSSGCSIFYMYPCDGMCGGKGRY
jgi:hypothetical protein